MSWWKRTWAHICRALECNSVRRYSYLALLEFKLTSLAAAGGGCRFDLESTTSSSSARLPITIHRQDVRLRDAEVSLSSNTSIPFNRLPQRGSKGTRTLAASPVTQWNRMSQSDTVGRSRIDTYGYTLEEMVQTGGRPSE